MIRDDAYWEDRYDELYEEALEEGCDEDTARERARDRVFIARYGLDAFYGVSRWD